MFKKIILLSTGFLAVACTSNETVKEEAFPGEFANADYVLSLIHISEPTRRATISRMPSSA